MIPLSLDLLDPRILETPEGQLVLGGLVVGVWGAFHLVHGGVRSGRSGDARYFREGLARAHFAAAIACSAVPALFPGLPKVWVNSAIWVLLAAATTIALTAGHRSIRLGPGSSVSDHAAALIRAGFPQESAALAEAALRAAPEDASVRFQLIPAYQALRRDDEAAAICAAISEEGLSSADREELVDWRKWAARLEGGRRESRLMRYVLVLFALLAVVWFVGRKSDPVHPPSARALLGMALVFGLPIALLAWRTISWFRRRVLGLPLRSPEVASSVRLLSGDGKSDLACTLAEVRLSIQPRDDEVRAALAGLARPQ